MGKHGRLLTFRETTTVQSTRLVKAQPAINSLHNIRRTASYHLPWRRRHHNITPPHDTPSPTHTLRQDQEPAQMRKRPRTSQKRATCNTPKSGAKPSEGLLEQNPLRESLIFSRIAQGSSRTIDNLPRSQSRQHQRSEPTPPCPQTGLHPHDLAIRADETSRAGPGRK